MGRIFKLFRKLIVSAFFIYGYNVLAQPLNIIIPLNIITIGYVSLCGVPAMISLLLIFIFSF